MAWPVKVFASIASFYLSFNLYIFLPKCTTSNFQELIWGSGCIDTNQYFSFFFFPPRISHNILLKINFNRLGKGIKEQGKGSPVNSQLRKSFFPRGKLSSYLLKTEVVDQGNARHHKSTLSPISCCFKSHVIKSCLFHLRQQFSMYIHTLKMLAE